MATFLFDKDVQDYLKELNEAAMALISASQIVESPKRTRPIPRRQAPGSVPGLPEAGQADGHGFLAISQVLRYPGVKSEHLGGETVAAINPAR